METGVARRRIDLDQYRQGLERIYGRTHMVMRKYREQARKLPALGAARVVLHDPTTPETALPTTAIRPYPAQYVGVWKLKRVRGQRPLLLATGALLGAVWFLVRFGFSVLYPKRIEWVMSGDWYQHALGFLHYRNSPWGFPLGAITTLAAPVGTSTALTDSNPWLSLLLKPLQRILPTEKRASFACASVAGAPLTATWAGPSQTRWIART